MVGLTGDPCSAYEPTGPKLIGAGEVTIGTAADTGAGGGDWADDFVAPAFPAEGGGGLRATGGVVPSSCISPRILAARASLKLPPPMLEVAGVLMLPWLDPRPVLIPRLSSCEQGCVCALIICANSFMEVNAANAAILGMLLAWLWGMQADT